MECNWKSTLLVAEGDVGNAAVERVLRPDECGGKVAQFRPDTTHHQMEVTRRMRARAAQTLCSHQNVVHQ